MILVIRGCRGEGTRIIPVPVEAKVYGRESDCDLSAGYERRNE